MAELSFILPAYKAKFLEQTLQSILGQTYSDIEVFVVDDCSPDDIEGTVRKFEDRRLHYCRNTRNIGSHEGIIAAWTNAVRLAKSKWFVCAGDDDVYLPDFADTLLRLASKYPHCDLFHARCATINSEGKWISAGDERLEFETQAQMMYARGAKRSMQFMPDFMFRTEAFFRMGGFVDFPLAWYSDDATVFKMSANGCAHSQEILFLFRWSGLNISCKIGDTIPVKITSGEMYKQWVEAFLPRVAPKSEEDAFLLRVIKDEIFKSVDFHHVLQLQHASSFWKLLYILRKTEMPSHVKRFAILSRCKRMFLPVKNRRTK